MDVADHLRLSQGEEVAVVQQVLGRVLETLPANVSFLHAVGADRRAHCSVNDGNSILENLFQRMLVGCSHIYMMSFICWAVHPRAHRSTASYQGSPLVSPLQLESFRRGFRPGLCP